MPQNIPDELISKLSEFVNANMGLYFPKDRWINLRRGIKAATPELAEIYQIEEDTQLCIDRLLASPLAGKHFDILSAHLTTGETYFLRDKNLFQVIRTKLLPEMVNSRVGRDKKLRIWSAGCCTGEEPYSVAILIDQAMPARTHWDMTILGTDLNASFLRKARKGVYTNWSFRDTPEVVVRRYFKKTGKNTYEIDPMLKEMVDFRQLNLVEDDFPSPYNNTNAMDVIFCRNVLMYFHPRQRREVIGNFVRSLSDEGWLILSPSETSFVHHPELHSVNYSGVILFRKNVYEQPRPEREDKWKKKVEAWKKRSFRTSVSKSKFGRPAIQPKAGRFTQTAKKTDTNGNLPDLHKEARSSFEKGRYADTVRTLEKLLRGKPGPKMTEKPKVMALLAKALANLGKMEEALKWCEKAVNAERINPGHHYLLSIIYQELGRLDESVKCLRQAIFLDANFIIAHFALGSIAIQQSQPDESKRHLKNALSLLLPMESDKMVPHGDGLTAGRLTEIVKSMIGRNGE